MAEMSVVRVEVDPPYDVNVGRGVLDEVGRIVAEATDARRVLLVSQPPIAALYADRVEAALRDAGLDVHRHVFADGEAHKTVDSLAGVWAAAAEVPLERRDAIVALGGGVVGDLAGFAAASYNRGIAVVQVPTTLLAQVDAAVGGKTGIDLPQGKNLVGAFHQPAAVVADIDTLATLPPRIRTEGFGEVVKYGLIRDPDLLDLLEEQIDDAVAGDPALLEELVARSVAVKAAVVAADERESGERAHLNLGHTYAHALETLTGYDTWLHGEAVAVGMLVALRLGERLGRHGPDLYARTRALLGALGLPTSPPDLDTDAILSVMARDKKADAGIRYVVLDDPGAPVVVRPDPDDIVAAITRVVQEEGAR
jgi:3-dehydroquinate synthase